MNKKEVEAVKASKRASNPKLVPEYWAEQASERFPSSAELTPWYPDNVQPARTGWYERFLDSDVHMQYWDGRQWTWDGQLEYVKSLGNPLRPCWRGLARPATSSR